MARDRRADPHCHMCHGSGTIIENEKMIDGEYWCSFVGCFCTDLDEQEMRAAQQGYADYLANGGTSLEDLRKEIESQ